LLETNCAIIKDELLVDNKAFTIKINEYNVKIKPSSFVKEGIKVAWQKLNFFIMSYVVIVLFNQNG